MNLIAVPLHLAPQGWAKGKEFVAAACNRLGLYDVGLIEQDVLSGKSILWLAVDVESVQGAGVTQVYDQAGLRVCEITTWGARDQRRCAPLLKTIDDYAHANGCDCIRVVGPEGWKRHLKDFSAKAVILEKVL